MESGIVSPIGRAPWPDHDQGRSRRADQLRRLRVLRINETPRIRVDLVKNLEAPGGIGEPGTSCVMPALTNAIFAATGKRIRKLPVGDQARTEA